VILSLPLWRAFHNGNYAKVVVMKRCAFARERLLRLSLARGSGRRKGGGPCETEAVLQFHPDKASLQECCGSLPDGSELPWHNSLRLHLGSAQERVQSGRGAPSRAGSRTLWVLAEASGDSPSPTEHFARAGVSQFPLAAVPLSAACTEGSGGLSCAAKTFGRVFAHA